MYEIGVDARTRNNEWYGIGVIKVGLNMKSIGKNLETVLLRRDSSQE